MSPWSKPPPAPCTTSTGGPLPATAYSIGPHGVTTTVATGDTLAGDGEVAPVCEVNRDRRHGREQQRKTTETARSSSHARTRYSRCSGTHIRRNAYPTRVAGITYRAPGPARLGCAQNLQGST